YVSLAGIDAEADVAAAALETVAERFGWQFEGEHKILFLTHRLIARKAGYETLWTAYNERGGFVRDRFQSGEDPSAAFLADRIELLIAAWRAGRTGRAISLIGSAGRPAAAKEEKARIAGALDELVRLVEAGCLIGD